MLSYPSRGVATLWWTPAPAPGASTPVALLGAPGARLLVLLGEPLPTVEIARHFPATPIAVSQYLRVLHAAGLLTLTCDGRRVLYHRPLGDQVAGRHHRSPPASP
ncbi:ArsR/SmtB family transcription factor [Streptomyces griseus]|uniref:ArsR/SmtB family transcription factor n=1 Tax=Streptomyces griseus TaxID=1911 RepID=UPI001112D8D1|nr:helix-turn-helix transcriptional regulator [Streptomyces griseus]